MGLHDDPVFGVLQMKEKVQLKNLIKKTLRLEKCQPSNQLKLVRDRQQMEI